MPKRIARWNRARDVWETDATGLLCEHSDAFSETWPTSGMTRAGTAYALPTWAPPTDAGACSSSPGLLPTPAASDGKRDDAPSRTFSWASFRNFAVHPKTTSMVMLATVITVVWTHNLAIGVVVGVFPVLGVPMPFVSAGGSSMIMCLTAAGLVVGLMRSQPQIKQSRQSA